MVCAPIWKEFTMEALKVHDRERPKRSKEKEPRAREVNGGPPEEPPPPEAPPEPSQADDGVVTVSVCADSQLLATRWCPNTYRETFTAESAPKTYCTIHGPGRPVPPPPDGDGSRQPVRTGTDRPAPETIRLTICLDTGKIAGRYCPRTRVRSFTMDNAPTDVCDMHQRF